MCVNPGKLTFWAIVLILHSHKKLAMMACFDKAIYRSAS